MEAGSVRAEGEAGSLLGAVAACWESDAEADNTGQDEEGGSCRQVEGAAPGSAVSHRGEEAKEEEEEEEEGRTKGRSPLDSGCVVCKKTPLNRTEAVVDEKLGMLGLVGLRGAAALDDEVVEVEPSAWIPGRPSADTPTSVVVSSFTGRARPRSILARMRDEDVIVLLMSLVRDLDVVVVELNEEMLLPPFVFALVNVAVVVLTPPFVVSEESFGLMPWSTPSVFGVECKGVVVVVVEVKAPLLVVVVK